MCSEPSVSALGGGVGVGAVLNDALSCPMPSMFPVVFSHSDQEYCLFNYEHLDYSFILTNSAEENAIVMVIYIQYAKLIQLMSESPLVLPCIPRKTLC